MPIPHPDKSGCSLGVNTMATAQQISDVRFRINDTDANHYAFTDTEVGDIFDEQGTVLRAAHILWGVIGGSGDKMQKVFRFDVTTGYDFDVATRSVERRLTELEEAIIADEAGEYIYEEDDDERWTFDWEDKIDDMIA